MLISRCDLPRRTDPKKYDISVWEKLIRKKTEKRENERKRIFSDTIAKLKQYFKNKKVKKVYLFGSILKRNRFHPFSDLDIGVEGLKGNSLQVGVELEKVLKREVDLILLEKCCFKTEIERYGARIL
jgi:predicted nucleotidyltransferase